MKYIIHRGITSKNIKENTYSSIKKALTYIDSVGVEFDIRLTKDNKIVLSHNSIINGIIIEESNYSDIIKHRYLPTLDKILSISSNKIFLIDIKTNNNYKSFGDILVNELNKYNKNIYLASFDKKIVKYIKNKTNYKKGIISYNTKNINYDFAMINYKTINEKRLRKINKEIFLWTIKDINDFKKKYKNIDKYYLIINKEE